VFRLKENEKEKKTAPQVQRPQKKGGKKKKKTHKKTKQSSKKKRREVNKKGGEEENPESAHLRLSETPRGGPEGVYAGE